MDMASLKLWSLLITFFFLTSGMVLNADTSSNLSEDSRIKIIRTLGSEYVALKIPLPINKTGLTVNSNGEFDWKKNEEASLSAGQFIAPGITVQITKINILPNKIVFEINGGGRRKKKRFLEQIQVGGSGGGRTLADPTSDAPPQGSYVNIQFAKSIPELSPEEVRQILSNVLDFSKKSAVKSFIESIPEEFQDAVKEKKAVVGMDKDLVIAALGRPLRKIREKKGEVETEEWVYGEKPQKVIFVTFQSSKVVSVKEY
jgi:hypothetical protein